jgi:hypothetical protein
MIPAHDSSPTRRLSEVKGSGVHELQEFRKQHKSIPHH